MKFIFLIMLILFSGYAKADEYMWCQLQIEVVKDYYKYSIEELVKKKTQIAMSNSVESLSEATGKEYKEMVSMLSKEKENENKANEFVIDFMKSFEIKSISLAIKFKEIYKDNPKEVDVYFWNNIFDSCVKDSNEKLQ